ncbi:MAG: hypothetical protein AAFZ04_01850 [Pseudomonadota bacterium]
MSKFYPLQKKLEARGWQVERIQPESNDWWSFQIWKLDSLWSPIGLETRLSFIIDPQLESLKEENVWTLSILEKPHDYYSDSKAIDFNARKNADFEQLVEYLDSWRSKAAQV